MSKGGSETVESKVEIPQWAEDAARKNLKKADAIAEIGYVPTMGVTMAAASPLQQQSYANVGSMANAFGMGGPSGLMAATENYMPEPTRGAGGILGYDTWSGAKDKMAQLKEERPAQYAAINAMFMDPVGGENSEYAGIKGGEAGYDLGTQGGYDAFREYAQQAGLLGKPSIFESLYQKADPKMKSVLTGADTSTLGGSAFNSMFDNLKLK